jgi:hypothetical protein
MKHNERKDAQVWRGRWQLEATVAFKKKEMLDVVVDLNVG